MFSKVKLQTPQYVSIDDFVCLRKNVYSVNYGDDSKKKLKGIFKSQSKHINIEEYKKLFRLRGISKRR